MEGTYILKYATANDAFTYYGNGCPNLWDDSKPGHGGSDVSCSTRIVQTSDSENQKNGTYYTFNSLAAGSGGTTLSVDNTNAPDSFCPLGWQAPYSGSGGDYYDKSRSWNYLLIQYGYNEKTTEQRINTFQSFPLSGVPAGLMQMGVGRLFYQSKGRYYWSSTASASDGAYYITANSFSATGKTAASAVRCGINPTSSTARWQVYM